MVPVEVSRFVRGSPLSWLVCIRTCFVFRVVRVEGTWDSVRMCWEVGLGERVACSLQSIVVVRGGPQARRIATRDLLVVDRKVSYLVLASVATAGLSSSLGIF